jgi:hypothetical protein
MYRKLQQLKNIAEVTINPATENTLLTLAINSSTLSPVSVAALAITSAGTSHTLTAGYTQLILQNTGSKIVYFGGSTVTDVNGIKLFPNQGWEFKGCEDLFKIYFITTVAETSTVRICEL